MTAPRREAWLDRLSWLSASLGAGAVEDVENPFAFVVRAADGDGHQEPNHFPRADNFELCADVTTVGGGTTKRPTFLIAWQKAMSSPA